MPGTIELIKGTIVPQLKDISDRLNELVTSHRKYVTKFDLLRCAEHEKSNKEMEDRLRKLEGDVQENTRKNRDQESRYKAATNRLWFILTTVIAAAILAIGSQFLQWKDNKESFKVKPTLKAIESLEKSMAKREDRKSFLVF